MCDDMGADHSALLFYCESRWLSRGKVIQRVFELRQEIYAFLKEENHKDAENFVDELFIMKLAYLTDIFEKLNILNTQLQGNNTHILQLSDKINGFSRKLELWSNKINSGDTEMFFNLKTFINDNKPSHTNVCMCHF